MLPTGSRILPLACFSFLLSARIQHQELTTPHHTRTDLDRSPSPSLSHPLAHRNEGETTGKGETNEVWIREGEEITHRHMHDGRENKKGAEFRKI